MFKLNYIHFHMVLNSETRVCEQLAHVCYVVVYCGVSNLRPRQCDVTNVPHCHAIFRCFAVDRSGFVIIHKDFIDSPPSSQVHITTKEPQVAADLVQKGIMRNNSCVSYADITNQLFWEVQQHVKMPTNVYRTSLYLLTHYIFSTFSYCITAVCLFRIKPLVSQSAIGSSVVRLLYAMRCISATYTVMRCPSICLSVRLSARHVRVFCRNE